MPNGWTVLDPADLCLREPEPSAKHFLRDAVPAVLGEVIRVLAVRPRHLSDVLRRRRIPKLLRVPEPGWHVWRHEAKGSELALTQVAQRAGVVTAETCPTTAVSRRAASVHWPGSLSGPGCEQAPRFPGGPAPTGWASPARRRRAPRGSRSSRRCRHRSRRGCSPCSARRGRPGRPRRCSPRPSMSAARDPGGPVRRRT